MNTTTLKKFAQEARKKLISQIGAKLEYVLTSDSAELREKASHLKRLQEAINETSKEQVIDKVAYTWFNRLIALRYMDVNDFQTIGVRVLTPPAGYSLPELLDEAKQGHIPEELPVDTKHVFDLLDGRIPSANGQNEAYKELLIGACNHLHEVLPFLFEKITDYTELLLPDDLISELSILHDIREGMSEADCKEIEVIGWLYQYYITDKKDEVIGKVVASEDIPAATQLFTPNWIVKYMVQNSLGAQWLATYPQSPLKGQMEYYIEPAEQTDEVNAQLAAITPSQLDPEELTLIDPASGSGHILVEAYELFKAIYLERGYRQRDVPQLILTQNLFGLDIDERAAQLTGFALMMKGRADDRRLFERGVKLNVMALVDSAGFDAEALANGVELSDYDLRPGDLTELKRLFEHATTFGSLIQVPEGLAEKLPALKQLSEATSQDLFVSEALKRLVPLVQQAELLAAQYDAVVANPPYMGAKHMNDSVKMLARLEYPDTKSDLFSMSVERYISLLGSGGFLGVMTPFTWMFLKSYEALRRMLLESVTLQSLIQPEYHAFFESAYVPICSFTVQNVATSVSQPAFIRLEQFYGASAQSPKTIEAICNPDCGWFYRRLTSEFRRIPGCPIVYWFPAECYNIFDEDRLIGHVASVSEGVKTGDNERFLRGWPEVDCSRTRLGVSETQGTEKWVGYHKGGEYRRWYGNYDFVLNWGRDGQELRDSPKSGLQGADNYFSAGVTWSKLSSSYFGVRSLPAGVLFDSGSPAAFCHSDDPDEGIRLLAFLSSSLATFLLKAVNPTLNFQVGNVSSLPLLEVGHEIVVTASQCVRTARLDWDAYERSWDFQSLPLLTASSDPRPTLESSYTAWVTQNKGTIAEMKRLEEENNRLFIDAYGLADELTPDVPIEQITLTVNPAYRYGGKLTEEEQWTRFRTDTMEEFISYAVGCMFGRYSLDKEGMVLANQGETLEDYLKQVELGQEEVQFLPDDDNIIPILDDEWFEDDIVGRFYEFLKVTFGAENFAKNLAFLEEALGKDVRKYFNKSFYADHIKAYKKRPIYWMFSSPKGSFNVLVYLHRYTPDTMNQILNGYLKEYQEKLKTRLEHLDHLIQSGSSTEQTKAAKAKDKLKVVLLELQEYERDILYPLATERITIDLDDGVLVNYNKFGNAVKTVSGLNDKKAKEKVRKVHWIDTETII